MKVSKYQRLLLKAYPAVELLALDLDNPAEIDEAARSGDGTGDKLFDFLWIELKDCKEDADALRRIDTALNEINVIRSAIAG